VTKREFIDDKNHLLIDVFIRCEAIPGRENFVTIHWRCGRSCGWR